MKTNITIIAICSWLILLLSPHDLLSQPWVKDFKNKKNPKFQEVQEAFNNHWKDKVKKEKGKTKIPKGKGYKQFKRWEWFWEQRVDKEGNFPNSSVIMEEWVKYLETHVDEDTVLSPRTSAANVSLGWSALGPSSSYGGYSGIGRLNCIAFHPTDPNTFWVGSPSGGLWKTTTGGTSWTTLTDKLPEIGVSAIAIDPANPNNIYIATGDRDHWDKNFSLGVMKSTNGGVSWSITGLSYQAAQNIRVKSLLIHPVNPMILIAATSSGIYRTTNGGTSWTVEQLGDFQEILFKPGDPSVLYASSLYEAQIFRSTNTGDTWAQVTFFSGIERIALAVTPANPAIVGALCSNNTNSGFGGYYTSTNSGASFGLTYPANSVNLLGWDRNGTDSGGQGWYDLCLAISPTNASVVYTGGVNTWKSSNGGANWAISTMWWDGGTGVPTVHADQHALAFNPSSPGSLYLCNDGGLYRTSDGGKTWTDLSNGLQITQFYRMGNSVTDASLTIAGAQDNGTKIRKSTTYTDVIGGDGMEAIIDYSNSSIMYGSSQMGEIFRSTDGGGSFSNLTESLPEGAWVTPYVIDPANPQILYAGVGGNVHKTTNRGASWTPISSSLSSDHLQTLAVAPSNSQIIYTGSYYRLNRTTNGGGSWTTVTLPSDRALTSIEIHPTNPQVIWITFSGYSANQKVYRTDNGGVSWTNISGTLPNLPVNTIEYDKNSGVLYLGNDVGVFVRSPSMSDWKLFNTGLPNVIISEMEIQYSSGRLRAATFGRGLWESELYKETATAQWNLRYGGSATDNFAQGIRTKDGGYLLGGSSNSGISGDKSQSGRGGYDFWVVKTDANGSKQWDKRFGGSLDDNLHAIIQTSDGGYLIGGSSASGVTGDRTQGSRGSTDFWIVKISATGTKQWDKRFGGSGAETVKELLQLSTGEYIVAGVSSSGIGGDKSQASQGGQDYWVLKLSSTGTKVWDRRFGGASTEALEGLVRNSDGSFLLAGFSSSGISGDRTQASRGLADYWVIKINSSGSKLWDRRFGGSADDYLYALAATSDGGYLLAGYSASGVSGDKTQGSQGSADYWIVKVSSTGGKQWDKRYGGSAQENLHAVTRTTDGGYLLGGSSLSGISGDKTQGSQGSSDYWAVKVNSTGTKQWDKRFGGSGAEVLKTVLQTSEGGYLLAGQTSSGAGGDVTQTGKGGVDYWLVKVSSAGDASAGTAIASTTAPVSNALRVDGAIEEKPSLVAYPNPFTDRVTIDLTFSEEQQVNLTVYDSQGREVANLYHGKVEAGIPYQFVWQPDERLASGIYFLKFQSTSNTSSRKLMLIR